MARLDASATTTLRTQGRAWVVAQMVLLLALVVAGPVRPGSWHSPTGFAVGWVLFALGGTVGVAGVLVLGRNRTPHPFPREGSNLVQTGIYRWVRHPLYLSLMVSGTGWALLWQSALALVAVLLLTAILDAKARFEERCLRQVFPQYPDYARRVRRFLPGIY